MSVPQEPLAIDHGAIRIEPVGGQIDEQGRRTCWPALGVQGDLLNGQGVGVGKIGRLAVRRKTDRVGNGDVGEQLAQLSLVIAVDRSGVLFGAKSHGADPETSLGICLPSLDRVIVLSASRSQIFAEASVSRLNRNSFEELAIRSSVRLTQPAAETYSSNCQVFPCRCHG